MSKVTIRLGANGLGEILVDGEPVGGVQKVELDARAGDVPRVKLSVLATELEVEAAAAEAQVAERDPLRERCSKCGGEMTSTGLTIHGDPPTQLLTCYRCGLTRRCPA